MISLGPLFCLLQILLDQLSMYHSNISLFLLFTLSHYIASFFFKYLSSAIGKIDLSYALHLQRRFWVSSLNFEYVLLTMLDACRPSPIIVELMNMTDSTYFLSPFVPTLSLEFKNTNVAFSFPWKKVILQFNELFLLVLKISLNKLILWHTVWWLIRCWSIFYHDKNVTHCGVFYSLLLTL